MSNKWEDVVDMDFPPCTDVDQKKLKASFAQIRIFRGCVRMQMGRLVTSQEIEDRKRRILKRDLF